MNLEQAIMAVCKDDRAQIMELEAKLAKYRESLIEVLALIDDQVLVRNIEQDDDVSAFTKQSLRIVLVLKKAVALRDKQP